MVNILQHEVLTGFIYPFLLVFFIVFAILEKTKLLGGDDKKQLNALVAFVIGMIFVAATDPKMIVGNLILFLTVGIVIVFVILMLWGFITGGDAKLGDLKGLRWVVGIVIVLAVIVFLFMVTGVWEEVYDWLFKQNWSSDLWTNVIFIVVIAAALALAIGKKARSS